MRTGRPIPALILSAEERVALISGFQNRFHLGTLPEQMNWNDRPGP